MQWHSVRHLCSTSYTVVCKCALTQISRDFNHRVKSVSMTFFKPEEVEKLKAGGNKLARDHWLATWTPDQYPLPDSQNPRAVKDFMHKKYEEKRWIPKQKVQAAPSFAEYPRAPAKVQARSSSTASNATHETDSRCFPACLHLFGAIVLLFTCIATSRILSQSRSQTSLVQTSRLLMSLRRPRPYQRWRQRTLPLHLPPHRHPHQSPQYDFVFVFVVVLAHGVIS